MSKKYRVIISYVTEDIQIIEAENYEEAEASADDLAGDYEDGEVMSITEVK